MYTFKISDDNDQEREIAKISDIKYELGRLKDKENYTLGISSAPVMNDITELHVVNSSGYKGIFKKRYVVKYYIGVDLTYSHKSESHGYFTEDFDEVQKVLTNFVELRKAPDYSGWEG